MLFGDNTFLQSCTRTLPWRVKESLQKHQGGRPRAKTAIFEYNINLKGTRVFPVPVRSSELRSGSKLVLIFSLIFEKIAL